MAIRDSTKAEHVARWLKSHSAGEKSFGRVLRSYFEDQADRTAKTIGENFPGGITPDMLPLAFDANAEHERLMPIVKRNLAGLLLTGARDALRAAERRLESKDFADDFDAPDLPAETVAGLRRALDDLEGADYWRAIQSETATNLRQIIEDGLLGKLSNYEIGMNIRQHLGGMPANRRAQRIARTESTSAMNAGHVAYMADLEEDGIISGREWNAIGDSDMRPEHGTLQGVVVPTGQLFSVAGYPAPYPGYFGLPTRLRANCRCTVLASFNPAYLP